MTSFRAVGAMALVAALLSSACSGDTEPPAPQPSRSPAPAPTATAAAVSGSPVGTWQTGEPVGPQQVPTSITFSDDGTAEGYDGCHRFSGRSWRLDSDGFIVLESGLTTLDGCPEPVQVASSAVWAFVKGDRITLGTARGDEQQLQRAP